MKSWATYTAIKERIFHETIAIKVTRTEIESKFSKKWIVSKITYRTIESKGTFIPLKVLINKNIIDTRLFVLRPNKSR